MESNMWPFIGVDIAGIDNSYYACMNEERKVVKVDKFTGSLEDFVEKICFAAKVVCIDAPLTWQKNQTGGLRTADKRLKELLHTNFTNWVMSPNSLQAVPYRGMNLARCIKMAKPTCLIIESHPRVQLATLLTNNEFEHLKNYKKTGNLTDEVVQFARSELKKAEFFKKHCSKPTLEIELVDGHFDAITCAFVASRITPVDVSQIRKADSSANEIGFGACVIVDSKDKCHFLNKVQPLC